MMVRKWLMRWRDHGGGSGGEVAVGGPKGELLASVHGFFPQRTIFLTVRNGC